MQTLAVIAVAEAVAVDAMRRRQGNTWSVAVSAVCSALSFVMMYLGSTTGLFDFSAAVVGGAVTVVLFREAGAKYAAASVAVCTVLSALLIPDKTVFILYFTAGGVYPIIKPYAEKLRRPVAKCIKGAVMLAIIGVYLLAMRIFIPAELAETALPLLVGASIAAFCVFVIYDIFLTRFGFVYEYRLKHILRKRG